ncbi:DNA polymerase III subunit alpha [Candidatus Saccharibacteria bacterium]|nr:DNA polymerase III subunit alpha [Candidatus Saccharibacteria bacterium]
MTPKKTVSKKTNSLKPNDFVHLHNHTQYSLLDGLTKIPDLIDAVKSMGMDSIAITDHGTLSGAIEFYTAAKSQSIKPIIGIETYVAARTLHDKEAASDKNYYHLIILAMNDQGYKNLMQLSTIANLEGFYYKPRIDRETLKKYNEGLIILSGCINGEFGDALRQGQYQQAIKVAEWYKEVFGDRYYIEIQDHGHIDHPSFWKEQQSVNDQAIKISKELNIAPVITGDAHYLKKQDQDAHEILLCVQTGSFLSDEGRMSLKEFELHVAEPEEIFKRWEDVLPEAITNTKKIAERCNIEIELGKYLIPKFPVPKGETEKSYLDLLTYSGLVSRYAPDKKPKTKLEDIKKQLPKNVIERASYELAVIDRMGFNGYFLIVQDFINWGKDNGIVFGPGRGSGAGSIIAYALRITELDPFEYDLLFERFLNPDRISMPDFDIDIQDTRRDEVINYCVEKYGSEKVANIVTFGRMAARNAVRDVARVLQVPYAEADRLAKMIPPPVQGRHIPLEKSLKNNRDLANEYKNNERAKEVFDLAIRLEGTIRSHGVHAAGVVIAPDDIVKFTPLERAQKGVVATQYSMGPIEQIGLLKIDFLGLSNLTIIKNTLRIVKRVYKKDIDIDQVKLDDEKTYELFQRGDTTGVFQFESAGMKRYLRQLLPFVFEDIIAMVALYRPGPLTAGLTDKFIARKNGKEKVVYDHELMKVSLQNTYGVLVYQEQVMQIAKDMCGFTGGEADTLRKAVGKKIRKMMSEMKDKIIEGAMKNGVDKKIAEKFWTDVEGFADYGFNKSHAACYGLIAYQTAYLKANFPAAFMAALLTSDYDDTDRLAIEISECKAMGIDVLPPDVNESFGEFAVIKTKKADRIRFGMNAIKNVGTGAVEEIIRARQIDGKFSSIEDFLIKTSNKLVNKKALESLVKAGALDSLADRNVLVNNLESMLAFASRHQKETASGQTDLFGSEFSNGDLRIKLSLKESDIPEINERLQITWERELLGIYLSKHPLTDFEDFLKNNCKPINEISEAMDEKSVSIGGSVTEVREIITKKGQKMAFVKIADLTSEIELVLFPDSMSKTADLWRQDTVVAVKGKVSTKGRNGEAGELKILVEEAYEVSDQSASGSGVAFGMNAEPRIYIRLQNTEDQDSLSKLKITIDESPEGKVPVVLVVGPDDSKQIIKIPTTIQPNDNLIEKLKTIFGDNSVKYQ